VLSVFQSRGLLPKSGKFGFIHQLQGASFFKMWTAMHGCQPSSYHSWAELLRPALFQIQAELDVYVDCAPLPAQSQPQDPTD
jgi:hypothetical protein